MHRLFALAILLPLLGFATATAAQTAPAEGVLRCTQPEQRIDESRFVRIGGIDQWITIRGERCDNPVILFVHGGPGNPLSPYSATVFGAWEKEFTLVQWDQRGAGKTFGRNHDDAALTIAGMARDGNELAEYLAKYLGQKKLILLGGSWGSALSVHMIKARPELFHAYLGVGQLVGYRPNLDASYRRLGELARAADDAATLAALEALGPPPWPNPRNFGALRRLTRTYEAKNTIPAPREWWVPAAPYADAAAQAAYEGGEDFSYLQFVGMSGDGIYSKLDLPALGTDFAIPFFLVQGAEDLVTMPEVAKAYFDRVSAPRKEYRLVQGAGHDPNAALLAAQLDMLRAKIRPLVQ